MPGENSQPVTYLVCEADSAKAIEIIRSSIGGDDIQDLGRVSEELLKAMSIEPGQFVPIDGIRHISQQQPQPAKKQP